MEKNIAYFFLVLCVVKGQFYFKASEESIIEGSSYSFMDNHGNSSPPNF